MVPWCHSGAILLYIMSTLSSVEQPKHVLLLFEHRCAMILHALPSKPPSPPNPSPRFFARAADAMNKTTRHSALTALCAVNATWRSSILRQGFGASAPKPQRSLQYINKEFLKMNLWKWINNEWNNEYFLFNYLKYVTYGIYLNYVFDKLGRNKKYVKIVKYVKYD